MSVYVFVMDIYNIVILQSQETEVGVAVQGDALRRQRWEPQWNNEKFLWHPFVWAERRSSDVVCWEGPTTSPAAEAPINIEQYDDGVSVTEKDSQAS